MFKENIEKDSKSATVDSKEISQMPIAIEDFRNYYLTQRASVRGRRNAIAEKGSKETLWRKGFPLGIFRKAVPLKRSRSSIRRDSWDDFEICRMVRAQFPSTFKEQVLGKQRQSISLPDIVISLENEQIEGFQIRED
eukprot:Seg942.4 transcript_id=Seg942.4/GoldUCD/mRNA.D3Y31 product="hypothetical protein" protein_id=Seg942.4/GoldUCD/D3Y31